MKRWKAGLTLCLAVPLAVSACSSSKEGTDSGSASANPGASAKASTAPKEPVKFSIFVPTDSWDPDNAYLPIMEQASNTKIDFQPSTAAEYTNKRNVVMASGSYPNIIRITPTEAITQKYIEDGLLLPIDSYLDKYPAIKNAFTQETWDRNRNAKDGKIYFVPRMSANYPVTISYRKDWLEQLGLSEPKTTDEYKAMLVAIKEKNPGKVKDLIPLTPNNNTISWVAPFLSAFGSDYLAWQPAKDNPKRLVFSNTLPEFKDGLLFLRDLRKQGLMDTEWMVGKSRGLFKFYAGTAGSTADWPQYIDLRTEAIRQVDPKGQVGYITSLKGPTGYESGTLVTPNAQDYGTAITKGTTPEQMDAIFRLINWQYTDGYDTMFYGVEGKSYDVVGGKKIKRGRDAVLKDNPKYDLYMLDRVMFAPPPRITDFTPENFAQITPDDFKYASDVTNAAMKKAHTNYAIFKDDPVIVENLGKITSAVDEIATKIILDPNVDADKAFAEYLNKLKQNKIDEVTEAINKLNPVK
ncbi:MAG: extracellular solute-binding protein [Paenibacillaceae bacterium]|nr:extracellular solute-binding protein [Paenibacillaceae bacterium]